MALLGIGASALALLAGAPGGSAAGTNLLSNPDFEGGGAGSLAGWAGASANLSLASDGHTGTFAARVAYSGTGSTSAIQTKPRPVTSTVAGTQYVADGFVRADTTAKKACLKIKEFNAAGTVVGQTTNTCVTTSTAWQALPEITYTTVGSGGSLLMQVIQLTPAAGDSFETDDLSLAVANAGTAPPPPPASVTATVVNAHQVDVSWTPPSGVTPAGYKVYRNGAAITGTLPGSQTSFSDTTAQASTTYTYSVSDFDASGTESAQTSAAPVTTPAGGVGDVILGAAGDIACAPSDPNFNAGNGTASACREKATSDLLAAGGYDAVLPIGDEQYECGTLSDFQGSYAGSWGRLDSIAFPTPGNHEYQSTGGTAPCGGTSATGYFGYFGSRLSNPVFPASASDPTKGYYSYDLGAWHIIALNTNSNCSTVACAAGSPQEQWLKADLAAHSNQCTLAYFHHPLFASSTSGGNPTVRPFWNDLYAAGADVVLNGHVHNYERFAPQSPTGVADPKGVREFIVGTGGKSLGGFPVIAANSQARLRAFGVLKLTLHATSYDWKFVAAPGGTGSNLTDSGTDTCH